MRFNPSPYSFPVAEGHFGFLALGEAAPAVAAAAAATKTAKTPWLTEERAGALSTLTSSAVGAGTQIASLRRRRRRRGRRRARPAQAPAVAAPAAPPAATPWPLIIGGVLGLALIGGYVVLKKRKGKQ
jgi:hypothetical protein